jgi:flagellin
MAMSVHTNFGALNATNQLGRTNKNLNVNMERLGTGYRVNSAADDAAGLTIANRMNTTIRGNEAGLSNIAKATDLLATAEGALTELGNIADRMTDLAVQASTGTTSTDDRIALQAEYGKLASEASRMLDNTTFAGADILSSTGKLSTAFNVVFGTEAEDQITVDVSAELKNLNTAINGTVGGGAGLGSISEMASASSARALTSDFSKAVSGLRAGIGAYINEFQYTAANIENINLNMTTSKGRIMDADFAQESAQMSKNNLLMQSGTMVLSQAKGTTNLALNMMQ